MGVSRELDKGDNLAKCGLLQTVSLAQNSPLQEYISVEARFSSLLNFPGAASILNRTETVTKAQKIQSDFDKRQVLSAYCTIQLSNNFANDTVSPPDG